MKGQIVAALLVFPLATPLLAQQRPPVRPLGSVEARSAERLSIVAGVRHLPSGAVLINDVQNRRVLLFDPSLGTFTVVADSTSATGNAYSGRTAALIPYRGDSTLFVDPTSLSMLVFDGKGRIGRVMSLPRPQDAMTLGTALGGAAFDPTGRLIYRAAPEVRMTQPAPGRPLTPPEIPDSAAIVRVDLATRQLDTLAFIRTPRVKFDVITDEDGRTQFSSLANPLPVVDDWAVLADGAVAIVRGRDYHVDWIRPDGSRSSSARLPFNWQRLTDEDKVAFIDSVTAARERMGADAPVMSMGGFGAGAGAGAGATVGGGGGGGGVNVVVRTGPRDSPPGGGPQIRGQGGLIGNPQFNFVPASELPDYKPPFFSGAVRADRDGNLWIRTIPTEAIAGGPVYDVVNGQGELTERVQVPEGRTIVGFGEGGVVYLAASEDGAVYLERARAR